LSIPQPSTLQQPSTKSLSARGDSALIFVFHEASGDSRSVVLVSFEVFFLFEKVAGIFNDSSDNSRSFSQLLFVTGKFVVNA
jgi:hypothetical protein